MKRMIVALGLGDFFEDGLEPFLEFAAVVGAGDQGAHVERDHAPVCSDSGTSLGDDALGEALDDRGLADAGLADQDGVVLGAPREHLDHAADLLVAADDRVELAKLCHLGEVAAEALQRALLLFPLPGLLGGRGAGSAVGGHGDESSVRGVRGGPNGKRASAARTRSVPLPR